MDAEKTRRASRREKLDRLIGDRIDARIGVRPLRTWYAPLGQVTIEDGGRAAVVPPLHGPPPEQ